MRTKPSAFNDSDKASTFTAAWSLHGFILPEDLFYDTEQKCLEVSWDSCGGVTKDAGGHRYMQPVSQRSSAANAARRTSSMHVEDFGNQSSFGGRGLIPRSSKATSYPKEDNKLK